MKRIVISVKMLKAFESHLFNEEKSAATIAKYMHDVGHFVCYVGSRAVEKEIVLAYKNELAQTYAVTSANSMLAAVNAFLKHVGLPECCVKPFRMQKAVYRTETRELTKTEYARLVEVAKQKGKTRLCLILQTICGTGIRVSELSYITVEAACKGEAVVSCKNKTRHIIIVGKLKQKLLLYAKQHGIQSGVIFVTRSGQPISRSNIWRDMKSLCEEANVPKSKVFPHNLRHLFARVFYGIEKDIAKLADILGHTNINTTRIYVISTGEEHRRKMEQMGLIL